MLSLLAKRAGGLLTLPSTTNAMSSGLQLMNVSGARGMAVEGVQRMKERESALENMYFSKEEERLLRELLNKMKRQADQHDAAADSHLTEEFQALKDIVGKYAMKEDDIQALLKWKHA